MRTGTRGACLAKSQPYPALMIFAPGVGMSCGGNSVWRLMRVGVYVDAFNLYYGGSCSLRWWGWLAGVGLTFGRLRRP